ncbi:hypothetical protein NVV94_15760 [Pseudomonas sp. LS1212]|uniref:hypothetical protein n=1 Tax=Pseudomonas sp. LS1212 TaxID=2972478 RepID=UPI00215BB799|nr:hypothetical protein [Pseudomonas sp. LS1212]UVJ42116.1 hypothetical protein NVV94_15760 [Pseudomonas sp. LS1212]
MDDNLMIFIYAGRGRQRKATKMPSESTIALGKHKKNLRNVKTLLVRQSGGQKNLVQAG